MSVMRRPVEPRVSRPPRFIPPMKAVWPSMIRSLRWLRQFSDRFGGQMRGGRKREALAPAQQRHHVWPVVPFADAIDEDPHLDTACHRRRQGLDELPPDGIGLKDVGAKPYRVLCFGNGRSEE